MKRCQGKSLERPSPHQFSTKFFIAKLPGLVRVPKQKQNPKPRARPLVLPMAQSAATDPIFQVRSLPGQLRPWFPGARWRLQCPRLTASRSPRRRRLSCCVCCLCCVDLGFLPVLPCSFLDASIFMTILLLCFEPPFKSLDFSW